MELRRAYGGSVVTLVFAVSGCGSCEPKTTPASDGASTVTATPNDGAPPPAIPAKTPPPNHVSPMPKQYCQAIGVAGDAGGIATTDPLPDDRWIDLGPGAKLTAKDPRTTRETAFEGPGRVRPCVRLEEESWLASGSFASVSGAGEVVGAEEWVMTPYAVVRYGSANVRVKILADAVELSVAGEKSPFVWLPPDVKTTLSPDAEGWYTLGRGATVLKPEKPIADEASIQVAADACTAAAERAQELAARIEALAGNAGSALGELAPRHVIARRVARAACGVAEVRVGMSSAKVKERLAPALRRADGRWRSLGGGAGAQ